MADHTGQQLGNYTLVRLLGRGGFAEVYLGEHVRLKTQAAIKVRYDQFSKDDAEEFLKEAQTIANLVHPHIVRIFDFDVQEGVPFLVMEYAPNGTLRQRYPKNTRVPLESIISNVKQVADALQYAHDEKFIHRDIKPENLLLGRRDDILLSDFGLALVAQSTRQQSLQELSGTAYYMAPEQLRGKPRPASDQYALGIVVYEWLTGTRPFAGSFSEVASQHMFEPPPALREKLPSISPAVEEVVMTALAKDPHQRFASVRSFANALEQASQVSASFPGANAVNQPATAATPQPVSAVQAPPQPSSMPVRTETAPPVQSDHAQQFPVHTGSDANMQPGYARPVSEQAEAAHGQRFSSVPPPPPPPQLQSHLPVLQQREVARDQYNAGHAVPVTGQQPAKRRTGLIIGLAVLLLLIAGGGIVGYMYFAASTPEKTLSAVCSSLINNDPRGFFNLESSHEQSQLNQTSVNQLFQQLQSPSVGGVKTCNFINVQQNGSNATAVVTITTGNTSFKPTPSKFTLIDENGTWKVDATA